ncbi:hypothetical protein DS901_04470 [Loktanella sp. D2R18]|uniref:DUF2484 family protein n=1 Tax=Rhodobacterales TaxID=204455 RepID=UPI000DEBAA7F|nr:MULTISPECIES: DUF2484 family protein [Rhodobacterales]MDO6589088.1 DUF2484 family protein [Yoonia sp. 1_MG-2023]RBW45474.1 hypothetical protein DS901_04470 [Loktanella sp. D2R18]
MMSLLAAALWVVLAFVMQSIPSNDNHWRRAYVLMAIGLPILIWVVVANGAWIGLAVFTLGASVFRWPLYYLYRWVRDKLRTRKDL